MTGRKIFNAFRAFVFSYTLFSVSVFLVSIFGLIISGSFIISDYTSMQLLEIFAINPWIFILKVCFSMLWFLGVILLIPISLIAKDFYDSINKIEGENS